MLRFLSVLSATAALAAAGSLRAAEISGDYLESRTCDVYTGPCFANSEVGLTGQQAILAWSIDKGQHQGVDLAGLRVVLAVRASNTLAFGGGMAVNPRPIKSVVLVDERATPAQRDALVSFVRQRAEKVVGEIVRVEAAPIEMRLDHVDMVATLSAGKGREVRLVTRKLKGGDCVCTNEEIFYPPLAEVENSEPAYAIDAGYRGEGLGMHWSNPKSRSVFLATFAY